MTWNEIFSRTSMFITMVSAAVVALALVAQATGFGPGFRLFALLVLPVVLLMGIATFFRLSEANTDDHGLVIGMNRLRHAYLDLAPELEPYFTSGYHDDQAGILITYGLRYGISLLHVIGGTPNLVIAIDMMVAGVIAALVAESFGAAETAAVIIGVVTALVTAAGHAVVVARAIRRGIALHQPRFPGGSNGQI